MNYRTRHILAILAVSTALCADQAVLAAPSTAPGAELAQIAGRLVDRLSRSFRSTTPAHWSSDLPRRWPERPTASAPMPAIAVVHPLRPLISPFQFRLPPPMA
jgi:hypothetical protein